GGKVGGKAVRSPSDLAATLESDVDYAEGAGSGLLLRVLALWLYSAVRGRGSHGARSPWTGNRPGDTRWFAFRIAPPGGWCFYAPPYSLSLSRSAATKSRRASSPRR